jgi:hypothetical protein
MRERKTTRVYGAVFMAIRRVAGTGRRFTISDVQHENKNAVRRGLSKLVEKSMLRRVSKGVGAGKKSTYQIV